jgi:UDP-N-acetylmuramoyl-L-alanyl-D-glutamate--2,6-diaminopimelate ligase
VRPNAVDNTTPEAPFVQATLAEMADQGVQVAILETSSHALTLDRVRGTWYRVGVFTNLSEEHLNFHGTFEAYRQAKSLLFQRLGPEGLAVINADDPNGAFMAEASAAPVVTYSLEGPADLRATDISLERNGMSFTLLERRQGEPLPPRRVRTNLLGRFNVANWLAAYGAARFFGADAGDLLAAAEQQPPIPGRMNLVRGGQPCTVAVDFAHTPRALETALATLREITTGKLFLVFGLAGGRDPGSRPVMGRLAAERTDFFVISMDDPGEESPDAIAADIAAGARAAGAREGAGFAIDLDRRLAIREVLRRAGAGDAVLLAGKGHEQRMVVRGQKLPWSDGEVALEEIRALTWGP